MKLLWFIILVFGAITNEASSKQTTNPPNTNDCNQGSAADSQKDLNQTQPNQALPLCIRPEKDKIHQFRKNKFTGPSKTCVFENYTITVFNISLMNTTDNGHVKLSASKLSYNDPPIDVFVPIEPFLNVLNDQKTVAIVTYNSFQQFLNNSETVLKSKVISVEMNESEWMDLKNLLIINFPVNSSEPIPANQTLSCQYFNETALKWDDMGSFTNLSSFHSSNTVTCSYNHTTPFAVLLVDMDMTHSDPEQWKILSYITYIGCSISSFFSAITIFIYTFMKSADRDNSLHIHVSLSAAIFLLNTSFLFSEWGATWSQKSACVVIAVIIQYSLLSCFSWMAIEAVHLYLLLIKVFNTYVKHYMIKLSLFGWGVPALLVGGSLCVYDIMPFYGTTEKKTSNTNEIARFCWITDTHFLYGMNITYFSLTFLFNTCILVVVTHQIFKLRCTNVSSSKLPSRKDICTILGLTLLLGMTWGLAFFTIGYTNYPVLYLFCILNTLQGLSLFLWFCITMKKKKGLKAQHNTSSRNLSSSTL